MDTRPMAFDSAVDYHQGKYMPLKMEIRTMRFCSFDFKWSEWCDSYRMTPIRIRQVWQEGVKRIWVLFVRWGEALYTQLTHKRRVLSNSPEHKLTGKMIWRRKEDHYQLIVEQISVVFLSNSQSDVTKRSLTWS